MRTSHYNYRLEFIREFNKGIFKGLRIKDALDFVTRDDANEWVHGCRNNGINIQPIRCTPLR